MSPASSPATPRKGDRVVAEDGDLGRVDDVLRSDAAGPVYLVVAVGALGRRRYPILHSTLVTGIDRARRRVFVRGHRRSLERLSESAPIVI